jgi:hypothetical protein
MLCAVGNFGTMLLLTRRPSIEDQAENDIFTTIGELEVKIEKFVKGLLAPLFTFFDFYQVPDSIFSEIVERFSVGDVI